MGKKVPGKTVVVIYPRRSDPDGTSVVRIARSITKIRNLASMAKLSVPKFREAMASDKDLKEFLNTIKQFDWIAGKTGILTIEDEHAN